MAEDPPSWLLQTYCPLEAVSDGVAVDVFAAAEAAVAGPAERLERLERLEQLAKLESELSKDVPERVGVDEVGNEVVGEEVSVDVLVVAAYL